MTFNWFDNYNSMIWYSYLNNGNDFKCSTCGKNIWEVLTELLDQIIAADNNNLYFPLYTDNEVFEF